MPSDKPTTQRQGAQSYHPAKVERTSIEKPPSRPLSQRSESGIPDVQWLADAPMFIDKDQLERFYDAVVRPDGKEGKTTFEITDTSAVEKKIGGGVEAEVSLSGLAQVFSFISPKLKAKANAERATKKGNEESETVEFLPIETPERQLLGLTLHYYLNQRGRIFFVRTGNQETSNWRDPESVLRTPRALVFLDLPSQAVARETGVPETKLIPTAAEFANGKVIPLFDQLTARNGERPLSYPEAQPDQPIETLRQKRNEYWQWFDRNFSATQANLVVEKASSENGRIRWIDFRLPVTSTGETLHLHLVPGGVFDTGVFAYNFIKRGFANGLRLVGTLKSGPSMNVLAVYEK